MAHNSAAVPWIGCSLPERPCLKLRLAREDLSFKIPFCSRLLFRCTGITQEEKELDLWQPT